MISITDIHIRDPFVVCHDGKYILYASSGHGVMAYVSDDLITFADPVPVFTPPCGFWATKDYWAPEVHTFRGAWYLFLSLKSEDACRGTQIFRSSGLPPFDGAAFVPLSDGPVTPRDWECLDGTLWEEDGVPYIVFCHEWVQVGDGEICAMPLTDDLRVPAGEAKLLFRASDALWPKAFASARNGRTDNRVTDGPFLFRTESGALVMLWSSSSAEHGYVQAAAVSESGRLAGPWRHDHPLLFTGDGGHGMMFTDTAGTRRIVLHAPNRGALERARIFTLAGDGGVLTLR